MEISSTMPPLPPLVWENCYCYWKSPIQLPAWEGFLSHDEQAEFGYKPSEDGAAELNILTPDEAQVPPSTEQAAAYEYLMTHQVAIRDSIVSAVFKEYPRLQEECDYQSLVQESPDFFDEDMINQLMPSIQSPSDLTKLMGLEAVRILPVAQNGIAYIGFGLLCTWDVEHGLGVMVHKERVVNIDIQFFSYDNEIAQQDADKGNEMHATRNQ